MDQSEREYSSEGAFEADRRRMLDEGWLVRRRRPKRRTHGWLLDLWNLATPFDSGGCAAVWLIATFPVLLVALVLGLRRKKRFVVEYQRTERDV